jgi:TolA-binding protein
MRFTMTHHAKTVGVALLLTSFLAVPALAIDPERPNDTAKQIQDLRDQVKALQDQLAARDQLTTLTVQVQKLTERLNRLEQQLERQSAFQAPPPPSTVTRGSSYFTPAAVPEPLPITGTIRLENRMGVTAFVTLNGRTYTIAPFRAQALRNMTPGSVTYFATAEGRGVQPPRTTMLGANETLTVTIRD